MKKEIWKILLPAIFTLLGVILGNYLTYRNSYSLFTKQKIFDNQRISYSKVLAFKVPWTQAIRTNLEAKHLSEYYERRYQLFTHNIDDFNELKRQYERGITLIKDMTSEQKAFFENLGVIQTCFQIDEELQNSIDELFNYKTIDVTPYPTNFKNQSDLDLHLKDDISKIDPLIKREYIDKIDRLISLLRTRLK